MRIPWEEYERWPGLNATAIKAGRLSMAHMRLVMEKRDARDTPAMRWGRLMHRAVLEPVTLATLPRFDGDRRGVTWATFKAAHPSGDIVTTAELESLSEISAAFARSGASSIVAHANHEASIAWTDDRLGLCKARLDATRLDGFVEYKSTGSIDTRKFMAASEALGYHLQLGWYARAYVASRGKPPVNVWVICQESARPYSVALYAVPPEILAQGDAEAVEIATRYRVAEATGAFPGPYDGQTLQYQRPAWVSGDGEWTIEEGGSNE